MRRRPIAARLLLAYAATACQQAPRADDAWVVAVVAADPMFGGGAFARQRVLRDNTNVPTGDPVARGAALDEQCAACDRAAHDLVRELVPPALAAEVMPFWRSDAGNALALAETSCLAAYRHGWHAFPEPLVAIATDARRVGEVAQRELREGLASGDSVSPPRMAAAVAAGMLRPLDADAVAAFYRSEGGQRWLELRKRAFARSEPTFADMLDVLRERGFLRSVFDDFDLTLPKATFDGSAPGGR